MYSHAVTIPSIYQIDAVSPKHYAKGRHNYLSSPKHADFAHNIVAEEVVRNYQHYLSLRNIYPQ